MERAATFIVDKRNIFFLVFIVAAIFSVFSRNWVGINEDLTAYLDPETETRQGLDIMDAEFIEYATAKVMLANISYERALSLVDELEAIEGVHMVVLDDTDTHYKNASALFTVTFDGTTSDDISKQAMDEIREQLADYDLYVSTEVGNPLETIIGQEMEVVLLIAIVIIIAVLLFTSQTYMEIPVLLITFIAAALLNMGTNFLFGTISYITNSIAVVLQLALAIDYAIILCHRYTEERKTNEAREAVIAALSKAVPEISASSLTTISGLAALTLMHFRLGYDMGIVLIKAIVLSMLSVFLLMPGLLMLFSKLIDRTPHRSFVPKIDAWGRLAVKTRYIIPPIFLVVVVCAFIFSARCPYVYGYSTLDTVKQNDNKIADKLITETFGSENFVALVVPSGNYETEAALLDELTTYAEVRSTMGLANTEAMDGHTLTSSLSPRQFAELTDQDIETVRLLYTGYAVREGDYGRIVADIDQYNVPLIDMFLYLYDQKEEGFVTLDRELDEEIDELYSLLNFAQDQLEGEHWSRFLIYLNLPEESEETFEFLDTIHAVSGKYYDEAYLVGMSVNERDLKESFSEDNLLISILSALFVIAVLIVTFRSVGLPVLLIIVIQSSIWINFSVPYLTGNNLFFIAYLIVRPEDFPHSGALGGMYWQREIERRAFVYGGGNYFATAQLVGDFLAGNASRAARSVTPSYKPGVRWGDLREVLPTAVSDVMAQALPMLGRKLRGFDAPDAVLTGPETRSSSPVRIIRDAQNRQSSLLGLYPCGEGAGYAGGITSAAVDGMKCAEALIEDVRGRI